MAATASMPRQRLGKNSGRYNGETIVIEEVLRADLLAAHRHGWRVDTHPLAGGSGLVTLQRPAAAPGPRVYLSTGIHGDEPAGPTAMRQLLEENRWPANVELRVCPCLNPTGFPLNRRENADAVDLNRDYRHLRSEEVRRHVEWLQQQPQFDLALCLHEDWEAHGFYLYEQNPDQRPSLAEPMIAAVSAVCPIDPSPLIDDRPAHHGIIRPNLDPALRPLWPEAFFLIMNCTRLSYTLEAPSDFPLAVRVEALVTAVRTALEAFTCEPARMPALPAK